MHRARDNGDGTSACHESDHRDVVPVDVVTFASWGRDPAVRPTLCEHCMYLAFADAALLKLARMRIELKGGLVAPASKSENN